MPRSRRHRTKLPGLSVWSRPSRRMPGREPSSWRAGCWTRRTSSLRKYFYRRLSPSRRFDDPAILLADPTLASNDPGFGPRFPEIADLIASAWRWSTRQAWRATTDDDENYVYAIALL